ncbi:MAG: hypothetical protein ABJ308_10235 [Halieaceae bacterium]
MNKDSYSVSQAEGITTVVFQRNPDSAQLLQAYEGLAQLEDNLLRLWDFRDVELFVSTAEVRDFAEHANKTGPADARVAILVASDIAYGASRILMAYRERDAVELAVFRDYDKAMDWLKNQGEHDE